MTRLAVRRRWEAVRCPWAGQAVFPGWPDSGTVPVALISASRVGRASRWAIAVGFPLRHGEPLVSVLLGPGHRRAALLPVLRRQPRPGVGDTHGHGAPSRYPRPAHAR